MKSFDPALSHFAETLAVTLRERDTERLREDLQGGTLPALGGDLDPSVILSRALALQPDFPAAARECAHLLARILLEEAGNLHPGTMDIPRKLLLGEALRLAAELPATRELFQAIGRLWPALKGHPQEWDELFPLLLWATVFQQVDNSLEGYWLELIAWLGRPGRSWAPGDLDKLFFAWRGLLWIPPPEPLRGDVVSTSRVEKGLLALYDATRARDDSPKLLRHAFNLLAETYPRSMDFWVARFEPRIAAWPEEVRQAAIQKWPRLAPQLVRVYAPPSIPMTAADSEAAHSEQPGAPWAPPVAPLARL